MKDGEGSGEGVVIKNYDYKNKYGRQTWAKIVTNEFKAKHHIAMGAPVVGCEIVEEKIVAKYVTRKLWWTRLLQKSLTKWKGGQASISLV